MSNTTVAGDMLVQEPKRDLFNEMMQGVQDMSKQRDVCQLQQFMEMEALNRAGAQTQTKPLFISCPCKRCSPFTL